MQGKKVRVATSIGELERTFEEAWGLVTYDPEKDLDEDCVFVGLYSLKDFNALRKHKGKKWVFWCGSDILHFVNGWWLDDIGLIRVEPRAFGAWIDTYCESWCENGVEQRMLSSMGIHARVAPSFLGDVKKFQISYTHNETPKLYSSVSGDDFTLYGWPQILEIADQHPGVEFHLYGNTRKFDVGDRDNVIVHTRVPKDQMNSEIKDMQGCIRMVPFDGFSEIVAKSLLMGQWPVSIIPYPHTVPLEQIGRIEELETPNTQGRDWLLSKLNKYPWIDQK